MNTDVKTFKKRAVCTIVSKNYLPFARTFAESYLEHNADDDVYVLLVDRVDGYFDPKTERFRLVELLDVGIEGINELLFKYNVIELNTAVKPFFLEYLFRTGGYEKLAYFDPDIMALSPMDELWGLLDKDDVVLTPHLTKPIPDDGMRPNEMDILLSGTYNLGFIAIKNTENVGGMLRWWQERLRHYCFMDVYKGYHVDQKWVDLAPGMFDKVRIHQHPGYNMAYWNLHERKAEKTPDGWEFNGMPARFYHFSGFSAGDIEGISKHQSRYSLKTRPDIAPLFETYSERVRKNGMPDTLKWPYAFDSFDNGAKVPEMARKMYGYMPRKDAAAFGDPFKASGRDSFFNWLNGGTEIMRSGHPVSRLWYEVYRVRPDLQAAFPDIYGKDREGFLGWCVASAQVELKVDPAFLPTVTGGTGGAGGTSGGGQAVAGPREKLLTRVAFPARSFLKNLVLKIIGDNRKLIDGLKKLDRKMLGYAFPVDAESAASAEAASAPVRDLDPAEYGVNVAGYFMGEFGVAEAARADLRCLEAARVPHAANNIPAPQHRNMDRTVTEFSAKNPYRINLVHVNADMVSSFVADKGPSYMADRYNIGYWVWETDTFPARFAPAFNSFREIWTPSYASQDAISKVSPVPVIRVPHSIDIRAEDVRPDRAGLGIAEDEYVFLVMFDFFSVHERKNPMGTVRAFREAFKGTDKARLVIKHINSEKNPADAAAFGKAIEGLNTKVIDRHLTRGEVFSLMASCDCYVSLHRSEGFGLTIAEAMALGKPVIATAYSGNTDFMNVNNSLPVKYRLMELEKDYPPYEKGSVWADPDESHAASLMRRVFEDPESGRAVGAAAKEDVRRTLSPEAVGRNYRARLEHIARNFL